MNGMDIEVLRTSLEWLERGHRITLGTVVRTWGSAPRPPGSMMAIRDDGQVVGSVSGGLCQLLELPPAVTLGASLLLTVVLVGVVRWRWQQSQRGRRNLSPWPVGRV